MQVGVTKSNWKVSSLNLIKTQGLVKLERLQVDYQLSEKVISNTLAFASYESSLVLYLLLSEWWNFMKEQHRDFGKRTLYSCSHIVP